VNAETVITSGYAAGTDELASTLSFPAATITEIPALTVVQIARWREWAEQSPFVPGPEMLMLTTSIVFAWPTTQSRPQTI
jgi:hypothetical protein